MRNPTINGLLAPLLAPIVGLRGANPTYTEYVTVPKRSRHAGVTEASARLHAPCVRLVVAFQASPASQLALGPVAPESPRGSRTVGMGRVSLRSLYRSQRSPEREKRTLR